MPHIIATDEAGYGPNLGPLVIGATRWQSSGENFDFRDALSEFVFDQKSKLLAFEKRTASPGLVIADSKVVYSSGNIELLERGVLACLFAIHNRIPDNVDELMAMLGVDTDSIQDSEYFRCEEIELPRKCSAAEIETLGPEVRKALSKDKASLKQLSVATVFPRRFNAGIEVHGNKASCLTAESLGLISSMKNLTNDRPKDRFDIRCDKHGGRNRYASSLQQHFGDSLVTIEKESRPCSRYKFDNGRATIQFSAKGESWLPIALASMCAKYVRELYMLRWNRFWKVHLPHLKPTKGYPLDAKRFKKEIESVQQKIGIADEDIWRTR